MAETAAVPAAKAAQESDPPPKAVGDAAEEAAAAAPASPSSPGADEEATGAPVKPTTDEPVAPGEVANAHDESPAPAAAGQEIASRDTPDAADAPASTEGTAAAESIPARVARIWSVHAEKDETLANADRLTVSSAYRQWAKTADLGLKEGEPVPPFTEVWLALNTKPAKEPAKEAKAKLTPAKDGGGKDDRELCGDFKRNRCRRGSECKYSHDIGREKNRAILTEKAPLSGVNTKVAKRNGEKVPRGDASKADADADPLADFAAEASSAYREGSAGGDEGAKAIKDKTDEGGDDKEGDKEDASRDEEKDDPMASHALEKELDARAAKRAERFSGGSAGPSSRIDEPLSSRRSRGRQDERKRRGSKSRSPRRRDRVANPNPEFDRGKCIEMFDTALRELCKEGLVREPPVSASIFNDRMRRLYSRWKIQSSPFERYGDLVKEAEKDGLVKVSHTGSQLMITWIKYKYTVLPPRSPRRDRSPRGQLRGRSRSRSRSRSRRPRGGAGGKRGGSGARGRGSDRDRPRGRPERSPRARLSGRDSGRDRGRRASSGDRGRDRGRRPDRERSKDRKAKPKPKLTKRDRSKSSSDNDEYSYSYDYTDDYEEDSYSASPSPQRGKKGRSRSKRRR